MAGHRSKAAGRIELPAVIGALDPAVDDSAIRQRRAAMRAAVGQGRDSSAGSEKRQRAAFVENPQRLALERARKRDRLPAA